MTAQEGRIREIPVLVKLAILNLASLASFFHPKHELLETYANSLIQIWEQNTHKDSIPNTECMFDLPTFTMKIYQICVNIQYIDRFGIHSFFCITSFYDVDLPTLQGQYKLWNDTETWPFSVGEGWHVCKP